MRPAVLSVSVERALAPIRNTVLAHAGYGVIPAMTTESALRILRGRHVCVMVISNSVPILERQELCWEAQLRGVPSVVLDPYDELKEGEPGLRVNPLDGPEVFLDALAGLRRRDHRVCPNLER
jgi:hypothetical protein